MLGISVPINERKISDEHSAVTTTLQKDKLTISNGPRVKQERKPSKDSLKAKRERSISAPGRRRSMGEEETRPTENSGPSFQMLFASATISPVKHAVKSKRQEENDFRLITSFRICLGESTKQITYRHFVSPAMQKRLEQKRNFGRETSWDTASGLIATEWPMYPTNLMGQLSCHTVFNGRDELARNRAGKPLVGRGH